MNGQNTNENAGETILRWNLCSSPSAHTTPRPTNLTTIGWNAGDLTVVTANSAPMSAEWRLLVYVWGDGEKIKFFKLIKRGKKEKREGRSETCL
jgi:hypothetical protein